MNMDEIKKIKVVAPKRIIKAPKRKRRLKLSETMDTLFIQLWEDNISQLRECEKKTHIYAEMAEAMLKGGYEFRPVDVKYKIYNLTRKYRECRAKMDTGSLSDSWPAYANVHRIIGNTRINSIKDLLLESGDSSIAIPSSLSTSPPPPLQHNKENSTLLSESINNSLQETKESFNNNLKEAIETINNNLNEAMESQASFEYQFLEMQKKKHEDLLALEKQKREALQAVAESNRRIVESIMNFAVKII